MDLTVYNKLKSSTVLFDRELGLASVTGRDRVSWLQGMVTNDVAKLETGQGCYAAHLNPQGKMLSHMVVLVDQDALWLVMERDNVVRSVQELDRLLIMEDASIANCTEEFQSFSLTGGGAKSLVGPWAGGSVPDHIHDHIKWGDRRVLRTEWGYDLFVPAGEAPEVRDQLQEAGVVVAERAFGELLRIEAGFPRYGVDVDQTTTFPELGDKGIDYQKGCYIGQEVVAKIKYIGHVNRRFVGLRLSDTHVPNPGSGVWVEDREVGRITSAVWSPGVGTVIALAFVRRGADRKGTELTVEVDGARRPALVVDLPFVHSFW